MSQENNGPSREDQELEEHLAGNSSLSRLYTELSREEPPAELDRQILGQARRATQVRQTLLNKRPYYRMMAPLALAATVLISFSLVLRVMNEVPAPPATADLAEMAEAKKSDLQALQQAGKSEEMVRELAPDTAMDGMERDDADSANLTSAKSPGRAGDEPAIRPQFEFAQAGKARANEEAAPVSAEQIIRRFLFPPESLFTADRSEPAGMPSESAGRLATEAETPAAVYDESSEPVDDPDLVLAEILGLFDRGEIQAAEERIREFLESFPDHPVSPKLREAGYE